MQYFPKLLPDRYRHRHRHQLKLQILFWGYLQTPHPDESKFEKMLALLSF
jgi:hypothetical protein